MEFPKTLSLEYPWLHEVLTKEGDDKGLKDETITRILTIPHDALRRDLEQIILYETGRYVDKPDEVQNEKYTGIIANSFILLGEVGEEPTSIKVILDMMRQSPDYSDYHFGDMSEPLMIQAITSINPRDLTVFMDFMMESGLFTFCKSTIPSAISKLSEVYPERRGEIIEWFRQLLRLTTERIDDQQIIDHTLAALIICDVIDMGATELLPEVKDLFDTGRVELGVCGDYNSVERDLLYPSLYSDSYELMDVYQKFSDLR